ncbi:MAG: hypothetical protein K6G55_07615 [Selenomonadaceae bacterium]|nr:hypothetical protein [Selenomonadaceae bacterium]
MLKKIFTLVMTMCIFGFGGQVDAEKSPPILTAELNQSDFPQLYPTYSWEPLPDTRYYEVQVVKIENARDVIVRSLVNDEALNRVTDGTPFTEVGDYYWQVRVINKSGKPLSDWSDRQNFTVSAPVTFAVLGDSISHGGAAYIPAGQLSCQWETYCDVSIKNLARSGDTTQMILDRFDNDVLPFQPKVLLIMAGVNDIRIGISANEIIKNLELIRDKCLANNITPVFCTVTPMNPKLIRKRGIDLTDKDWMTTRNQVNFWIMQRPYFVDVTGKLTDNSNYLRAELTPDGLHPALRGKIFIGQTIANYLHENFPNYINVD